MRPCKFSVISLGLVLACAGSPSTDADVVDATASALRTSSFDFDANLRGSGNVTIHANVYSNPQRPFGETVLAIHGLAETGSVYGPLARAVSGQQPFKKYVGRVIAISLPGHGDSGFPEHLPSGVNFGQLTIEDNVAVVLQALDALRARGTPASVIAGHSMGGLAVQAAQQTLLTQGSSLAARGVRLAILLAPVPPHGRPGTQPPPSDLSAFVVQDPGRGPYLALSNEVWLAQAFGTHAGRLAPNAPTPDEVSAAGYNGLEPLTVILQLLESPTVLADGSTITVPRPSVEGGAFARAKGTRLVLLSFSEDVLVPAADLVDLYGYLTRDSGADGLREIVADDAVHSMFISNPQELVDGSL
ncbi:MAG TPA: alpha/beta hydrolase [Polyangiales bacterium]|nr:alpha/beta hydrolase [Polyangiales bacterium]